MLASRPTVTTLECDSKLILESPRLYISGHLSMGMDGSNQIRVGSTGAINWDICYILCPLM